MERNNKVATIIASILIIFTLIGNLSLAIVSFKPEPVIYSIVVLIVAYYAVFGYKKPHGNLMRYVILLFALGEIAILFFHNGMGDNGISIGLHMLAVCIMVYVAGRLNKVKQNCVLIPLAFVLIVVSVILVLTSKSGNVPIDVPPVTEPPVSPEATELPPDMPEMIQNAFENIISYFSAFSNAIVCWVLGTAYFMRYRQHKEAGLIDKTVE